MQNSKMLTALCSSNWYLLPVSKQRDIMLVIAVAQRPTIVKAGTVPVNLNTFVNVRETTTI